MKFVKTRTGYRLFTEEMNVIILATQICKKKNQVMSLFSTAFLHSDSLVRRDLDGIVYQIDHNLQSLDIHKLIFKAFNSIIRYQEKNGTYDRLLLKLNKNYELYNHVRELYVYKLKEEIKRLFNILHYNRNSYRSSAKYKLASQRNHCLNYSNVIIPKYSDFSTKHKRF